MLLTHFGFRLKDLEIATGKDQINLTAGICFVTLLDILITLTLALTALSFHKRKTKSVKFVENTTFVVYFISCLNNYQARNKIYDKSPTTQTSYFQRILQISHETTGQLKFFVYRKLVIWCSESKCESYEDVQKGDKTDPSCEVYLVFASCNFKVFQTKTKVS